MKHACMYMDPTGRYLVPIKISVINKTVLIQRMALYPATATCIASAPLVPEPSSTSWDETYHRLPGSSVPPPPPSPRDRTANI